MKDRKTEQEGKGYIVNDKGDMVASDGPFKGRVIGGPTLNKTRRDIIESSRKAQEERERRKPGSTQFTSEQLEMINHIKEIEKRGGLGKLGNSDEGVSE